MRTHFVAMFLLTATFAIGAEARAEYERLPLFDDQGEVTEAYSRRCGRVLLMPDMFDDVHKANAVALQTGCITGEERDKATEDRVFVVCNPVPGRERQIFVACSDWMIGTPLFDNDGNVSPCYSRRCVTLDLGQSVDLYASNRNAWAQGCITRDELADVSTKSILVKCNAHGDISYGCGSTSTTVFPKENKHLVESAMA